MESKTNDLRTTALIMTDDAIYRMDEVLSELNQWLKKLDKIRNGKVIPVPYPYVESLEEYESHLQAILDEHKDLIQAEMDSKDSDLNF